MTKEEREKAIEEIKAWTPILLGSGDKCTDETVKAQELAIEALKQEPCEDAISRKAVAEIINRQRFGIAKISRDIIKEKLEALPSVTPAREHGEWRETGDVILWHKGILLFECQCSKCKGLAHFRKESLEHKLVGADFCPCCGADMRKEQNNV